MRNIARSIAIFTLGALPAFAPLPAMAVPGQGIDRLVDALALDEIVAVMREEGLTYGTELGRELFPDGTGAWGREVARIYDADAMRDALAEGLEAGLVGTQLPAVLEFFETGPGARFARLEASARRAMLAPDVEAGAEEVAALAMRDETPRFVLVDAFVEANDLIEANVAGALNANLAFSRALLDGGAFGGAVSEAEILGDVWAQEPQIRQDTTEWLYAFLMLAYGPATEVEMQEYVAFSKSPAGRELNRALFAAYDEMLTEISRDLGASAARLMAGQEI